MDLDEFDRKIQKYEQYNREFAIFTLICAAALMVVFVVGIIFFYV